MLAPFGETVTVYREVRDRLGNVEVTDERQVHHVIVAPRSAVASGQSSEISYEGRNSVTSGLTLFVPPGSNIRAEHRVRLTDGTVWQVDGDGRRWSSPFSGWTPGEQVELDRVTG